MSRIDFTRLWEVVPNYAILNVFVSCHGVSHWKRVERNGMILADAHGANVEVVRLFALFHDSQRESEYTDPEHGARGAALARKLRGQEFELSDAQFAQLEFACQWHTDLIHHQDVTIACCFDADRLDLDRVGIRPASKYLNTSKAKEISMYESVAAWMLDHGYWHEDR